MAENIIVSFSHPAQNDEDHGDDATYEEIHQPDPAARAHRVISEGCAIPLTNPDVKAKVAAQVGEVILAKGS